MKNILIVWFILCSCVFGILPNQPHSVGISSTTAVGSSAITWGTLFEPTNTYFVSCGHDNYYPHEGYKITFGNGDERIVEKVWVIGVERNLTEFDLVIGKLNFPVNTKPSSAWWHLPKSFFTDKIVTGFAFDGAYQGIGIYRTYPGLCTDYIVSKETTVTIQHGYSGSPMWHKERLIGVATGRTWPYTTCSGTPLFMALIKCQEKFPEIFRTTNTETNLVIEKINETWIGLETNLAPGNDFSIEGSLDMNNWFSLDTIPEFYQYDEISEPWKRYYAFNTTGRAKMFFRGKEIP